MLDRLKETYRKSKAEGTILRFRLENSGAGRWVSGLVNEILSGHLTLCEAQDTVLLMESRRHPPYRNSYQPNQSPTETALIRARQGR